MNILKIFCSIGFLKKIIVHLFQPKENIQYSLFNIQFKNKVGLGAGFDKNASYLNVLEALGFGFVEIGTVTPLPQDGNDKPRVFRLPADKALINRMGFNNEGVEVVAQRLKKWKDSHQPGVSSRESDSQGTTHYSQLVIGGNIGKNKITPNEYAWKDYEICFNTLHPYVDYFVVNVSSPNTPGLRELQEKESLKKILTNLQMLNTNHLNPKPIFLKIAPDLSVEQLDDVIDLAIEIKLDGLVATNTTISREPLSQKSLVISEGIGAGGLSGLPVQKRSTEIIQYIHQKTNGQIPIIASGGIFTAADAQEKLHAGASLVQVWTGFIYEGPAIVKNICNGI